MRQLLVQVLVAAMACVFVQPPSVLAKDQQIREKIWISRKHELYFAIRGKKRDGIGVYSFGKNLHGNWLHSGDGVKRPGELFRSEVQIEPRDDGGYWIQFPYGKNNDWRYRIDIKGPIRGHVKKSQVSSRRWRDAGR